MIWLISYFIISFFTTLGFRLFIKEPVSKNSSDYFEYQIFTVAYGICWFVCIPIAILHVGSRALVRRITKR